MTEALRRKELDILTSQDDGTASQDQPGPPRKGDRRLGCVPFSQDQDFLRIAAECQLQGRPFVGVLFAAQQGVSLGRLANDLELILTCCESEELRDWVTYLPLR